jgi:predicted ATPase/class 3 adenylate cyclase
MALPAGTVTLMFSDIEGSTGLLEQLGEDYAGVLDEHRKIVRGAVAAHGGHELRTEGDAFFVVFTRAGDAVRAAVSAQRALAACTWSSGVTVRVRMGLHTGEPRVADGDYVGIDVHYAARICSAAHGGQIVVSETTQGILAAEAIAGVGLHALGEHRLKDLTRAMCLYQIVADGLTVEFPPLRALENPPKQLLGRWASQTALFGREADLEALAGLVRAPGNRLVTLVGPGGVGKTRLAIAAAGDVAGDFADGAWFVALAAASESHDLASAIVTALSAPVRRDEPARAALTRSLADRRVLLVLDNFEQLLDGAPLVADLLGACPGLTVLVTSREPTRLAAEQLYPVRPLAVPDASASTAAIELERYGAVAMFCDRARARDPAFTLDETNAPPVCEICRRLDGLPLALELAAARCGLLSALELSARLDRALAMLVGGARDAPERHHTLRATIDWSYDLLTSEERRAFAHMAVFAGGATVAAAEAVIDASLDTLDSLVAKQLLTRRDERLLMLETIREYAVERLAGNPDRDAIHERLAAWCLSFLHDASPHLVRADRAPWLARLDAEHPNMLGALSWAIEQRRAELALELVGALGDYWWQTPWSKDAREDNRRWIDSALKLGRDASPRLRAGALLNRGRLTSIRGSEGPNRGDLQKALELYHACDDARGVAACLGHLAFLESWAGNYEAATALSDQAVRYAERAHDETGIAFARAQGVVAGLDYEDTARRARSATHYLRRIGNLDELGRVCNVAGYVAIVERRYREALAWLDEGLEATRALGNPNWPFMIQGNRGLASLFLGELDEAAQQLCASLALAREGGRKEGIDEPLLGLAAVEASRAHLERAARLTGAAKAHELPRQFDEDVVWSRLTDDILAAARERHGLERWDLAERQGMALNVPDALDLALQRGRFAPGTATTTAAAPS